MGISKCHQRESGLQEPVFPHRGVCSLWSRDWYLSLVGLDGTTNHSPRAPPSLQPALVLLPVRDSCYILKGHRRRRRRRKMMKRRTGEGEKEDGEKEK